MALSLYLEAEGLDVEDIRNYSDLMIKRAVRWFGRSVLQ